MKKKTVLFVSELGSGFGHVRRMLPFARAAVDKGYKAVFLVQNPDEVEQVLDFEMVARRSPCSISDNIIQNYDANTLRHNVELWRAVLENYNPQAIVCEFSPMLLFACSDWKIPVLSTGYGHIIPPCKPTSSAMKLAARELDLPLTFWPYTGTREVCTGLEELDPWSHVRTLGWHVGPIGTPARRTNLIPTQDIFAYLQGGAPATFEVAMAIRKSKVTGCAYIRNSTAKEREVFRESNVQLLEKPSNVFRQYDRSAMIVHHGSTLMAEECLISGKIQVLAPIFPEHGHNAKALAKLGVAKRGTSVHDCLTDPDLSSLHDAAQAWAMNYESKNANCPEPSALLRAINV